MITWGGRWLPSSMTMVGSPYRETMRLISLRSVCDPWNAWIRRWFTKDLSSMSTPMIWARGKNHFHMLREAPPSFSRA